MSSSTSSTQIPHASSLVRTKTFNLGSTEHQVRILGSNEELWFVASDLGKVLGIVSIKDQLKGYEDGTEKGEGDIRTPGGVQKMIILSEMAVYKFLMRSQKKEAEPFQKWVASILKTIRLEGRYELPSSSQKLLTDAETARVAAEAARVAAEKEAADAKAALIKEREEKESLKRRLKNKHQKGQTVYIARNPADRERELYKIGHSKDVCKRSGQYSTSMPDGVDMVHCVKTCDANLVERVVQHILDAYRYDANREWFQRQPAFDNIISILSTIGYRAQSTHVFQHSISTLWCCRCGAQWGSDDPATNISPRTSQTHGSNPWYKRGPLVRGKGHWISSRHQEYDGGSTALQNSEGKGVQFD
jgi:prophage antirepressor-like protein